MRQLLELEIDPSVLMDHNERDIMKVLKNLEICNQSLDAFLAAEITFAEYVELLETAEINIDGYLGVVEKNLVTASIL
jgi:hypothetical protein